MSRPPRYAVDVESLRITAEDDVECATAKVDGATLCPGMQRSLAFDLELEMLQTGLGLGRDIPGARESVSAYAVEFGDHVTTVFRLVLVGFSGRWSLRTETYQKTPTGWVELGAVLVALENAQALAAVTLRAAAEPAAEEAVQ